MFRGFCMNYHNHIVLIYEIYKNLLNIIISSCIWLKENVNEDLLDFELFAWRTYPFRQKYYLLIYKKKKNHVITEKSCLLLSD